MPRPANTTDRQNNFLRAFRQNPAGPAPDAWPSPAILRRWLRSPAFRAALASLQSALRLQTDFLIASAASSAARSLDAPAPGDADPRLTRRLADLLRLAHLRHRFTETRTQPHEEPKPARKPQSLRRPAHGAPSLQQPLTPTDFRRIAPLGWTAPLEQWPGFPAPTPQDTFYYKLIQNPFALLWYMKRYDEYTQEHRFSAIVESCRHLMREEPSKIPHIKPTIRPDTAP